MSTSFAGVLKYREPAVVMPTDRTLPIPAFNRAGLPCGRRSDNGTAQRSVVPLLLLANKQLVAIRRPSHQHVIRRADDGGNAFAAIDGDITKMSRCHSLVACRDVEREGSSVGREERRRAAPVDRRQGAKRPVLHATIADLVSSVGMRPLNEDRLSIRRPIRRPAAERRDLDRRTSGRDAPGLPELSGPTRSSHCWKAVHHSYATCVPSREIRGPSRRPPISSPGAIAARRLRPGPG